ncbi:hypothetical protein MRX96_044677 [Rhipicephalus microplus]
MDIHNKIKIWHSNANGFRCRKAILQQYLRSLEPTACPDVIAVQETHTEDTPTLPGYRAHACPPSARTCGKGVAQGMCTFIRKGTAHVKHQQFLGSWDTTIELNPRHGKQKFKTLFHKTKSATSQAQKDLAKRGDAAAIICGDFNAQHREVGYTTTTSKGRDLLEDAGEAEFTLLTNPAHPSRIGTSAARDTNPDVTFAMLPEGVRSKSVGGGNVTTESYERISQELGREIERHSRQLCSQQWFALCSQVDGQLQRGGTWKLLRQLME